MPGQSGEKTFMRMLISFAALFLSVILLQLSSGGVGPLDVLSGSELGFSRQEIEANVEA